MIPPEIARHLSAELRRRLEPRARELSSELERLAARARASRATGEEIALAAGALLAMQLGQGREADE